MNFDSPVLIMAHIAAFAFFVALAITGLMIFAGLLDQPDHRSNHKQAVPTAGGLGIIAGFGAGMLALALYYPAFVDARLLGSLSALGIGVGLLGMFDDVYDVNPKLKFLTIIVLAAAGVFAIGPPTTFPVITGAVEIPYGLGFIGAVLWVFVVTNGVNFMDGSNGLMASSMSISFGALSLVAVMVGAGTTALLSMVMVASLTGFLPYNVGKQANIFSGDVGSLPVGFIFACASLILLYEAPSFGLLYVGPLLILPFLTDILLTMLLRALRRENLLVAHNTHLYQRLIREGKSHNFISVIYGLAAVFMAGIVVAGFWFDMLKAISFLIVWVSVFSLIYLMVHQKLS